MSTMESVLAKLEVALAQGKVSAAAAENIRCWLREPYYSDYSAAVAEHILQEQWRELDEAFWTTIPFGTGGRRGRMYPIGCNAINDRTIGESAQGLADYVKSGAASAAPGGRPKSFSCAVAYDTRHNSRHFAELCAEIMAAAGFKVYFLDGHRATPELSFAVRHHRCDCGMMITASHNPPSDNAVKVYGANGGQYIPPQDAALMKRMQQVTFVRRSPFAEALESGQVVCCQAEVDAAYIRAVLTQNFPGPRKLRILYSPLHGVGATAVYPVLRESGFREVEIFEPHATPDGDFPNVPGHLANPENPAVFESIIEYARRSGTDIVLATDPDCDRLGCAAKLSLADDAPWATLTGNQLGSLLLDFLAATRKSSGTLFPQQYVVKTLVTSELIRRVAEHHGLQAFGDLPVGFKWIGAEIDARGPENFLFAAEESYGFLAGAHVRDKDGAVASLLTAQAAAALKAEGKTLHQRLDELFLQFGCHTEGQLNLHMPGSEGMEQMHRLMARLRTVPPQMLGGQKVVAIRDYLAGEARMQSDSGWESKLLKGLQSDMVVLDLENCGDRVAVRPSGTEPKVKIYLFAYDPPGPTELSAVKAAQTKRLQAIRADLQAFAAKET